MPIGGETAELQQPVPSGLPSISNEKIRGFQKMSTEKIKRELRASFEPLLVPKKKPYASFGRCTYDSRRTDQFFDSSAFPSIVLKEFFRSNCFPSILIGSSH